MSPETPGQQTDLAIQARSAAAESGALRPEDIKGLTPEQLDDHIREAIAKFNTAFEDFDPDIVREAFKNEEPRVTSDVLVNDLSGLEERLKAKLETTAQVETAEARKARLGQFVETHFSDICPPEHRDAVTQECIGFENELRIAFDDETTRLEAADASDATLREKVVAAIPEIEVNNEAIAARTEEKTLEAKAVAANTDKISTGEAEIAQERARSDSLQDHLDQREIERTATANDLELLKHLPTSGDNLHTLQNLLDSGQLKSPEIRTKVANVITQLRSVANMGSTPEAQSFFKQAVAQQPINFAASSPIQMYASLISHIDSGLASGTITESDANAARVTLGVSPRTSNDEPYKIPKDSSQMARDLRERRNTEERVAKIDPATGEPMIDEDGNIIYETVTRENNDPILIDHESLEIYLKPVPGSDAYNVHILSDSRLPLVERIDANNFAMGGMREINYLVATADMEQQGFTDIFGSQFTSNEVRRHNYENFMRSTGMNPDFGNLWTTEHSDRIRQFMQTLHPRGDLGRDDVNPQNWKLRAVELGVYNAKADQWDYDALSVWRDGNRFDVVGKDGDALQRSGKIDTAVEPKAA